MNDYRNTLYSKLNDNVGELKCKLENLIKSTSKFENMYNAIRDDKFRDEYRGMYNYKCSYCGISKNEIHLLLFENDHFDPINNFENISNANTLENLVNSCKPCNRSKSGLVLPDEYKDILHPDKSELKNIFARDDLLNIKITEPYLDDKQINNFYEKLRFNAEFRRLDYILMMLNDLKEICDNSSSNKFYKLYELLNNKRDILSEKKN